ncbi:MAG: coproporphyrinogen dehydrogenase HemZ [Defluviitaleaceae bacterium]|nr:coproporphyrinogen dehydrogenase HemZ [Defluviitaleaceae bacterium]
MTDILNILVGHQFVNEVQTVTQLFFPGEGFKHVQGMPADMPKGYGVVAEMTADAAVATVLLDGKKIGTHTMPLTGLPLHLSPRRLLMLALYHALQQAVGAYTPWGALTGIRPTKMVREWLAWGWSDEKVLATLADPFCCTQEKGKLALTVAHAEERLTARIYEQAANPVGIYLSVPFCPTRCLYCSFNVDHNFASKDIYTQYVAAVARECKTQAPRLQEMGGVVSSVYIGGGTPTVLPKPLLEQLLNAVAENFDTAVEYSVEAGRPDTLTKEKLAMLRRYGVNRIAVNPQTLKDGTLQKIGRKHTAADFFTAFHLARDAGFDCINADLIVGLPGETVDDVHRTMEGVAALSPENITVHTLAVKRASRLNLLKGEYALPDAHTTEAMLAVAEKACQSAGLSPYYMYRQKNMVGMFENVGYAKPGCECLYNVGMMAETQTVLGIGAGAVSKFVTDGYITREFNVKNPEVYVARQGESQP